MTEEDEKFRSEFLSVLECGKNSPDEADGRLSVLAVKIEQQFPESLILKVIDEFRKAYANGSPDSKALRYKILLDAVTGTPSYDEIDELNVKEYIYSLKRKNKKS